ncbi:DUF4430 domain-containing protein [Eubacterium sp. AM49-13BH]|nr:DUF4430 domain-containing protein [Eubacterium sp. AM49-13BH]
MFNKYRNIKKIGLMVIGLALVVFLITNVRIRSVDSYRKQFSNIADAGQTQPARPDNNDRLQNETIGTGNGNAADNGSFDGTGDRAVSDDNSASGSTDNITVTDNNSGSGSNESDRSNGNAMSAGNDSGSSNSGNNGSESDNPENNNPGNNSQNTRPAGKVISCTIEIRCDNATARKDTVNPSIASRIPDDGTILEVTTYTAAEGFTVYDVLAAVTAMHNPVIPIVANSDKSYVSSINNLSEKNVGPQSGWTYRVNGVLPMMAANQYTVKDGDVIKWIYVCQLGDK